MSSTKSNVDAFLATTAPRRGGVPCQTCAHPRRVEINEAALHFNTKRRDAATALSWAHFVDKHIKPTFGYGFSAKTLKKHLQECENAEIH